MVGGCGVKGVEGEGEWEGKMVEVGGLVDC